MTSTSTVTFVPGITRSSTSKQWLQLLQLPSFLELPDPAPPNNDFNSYSYLRSWNYQIQHLQTMTSTPTVTFVPGITRSSTSKQWLQLLQLPSFLELPDPAPPNNDFNSYSYLRSWNYEIQHLQTMTSTPTVTFVPGITRSSTSKQWLQHPTVTFVPGITRSSTSKQWLQLLQLPSLMKFQIQHLQTMSYLRSWNYQIQHLQTMTSTSYSYLRSWNYQIQHLQTMTSTPQLPSFLELPDPAPPNNDFNSYSTSKLPSFLLELPFVPGIPDPAPPNNDFQLLQLPSFLELPDPAPPNNYSTPTVTFVPGTTNNDFNSYSYLRSWNYQIQHLQTMTSTPTVTFVPVITRSSTSKQWLYSYLRSWDYQIQHLQTVPGITRSTSKQWLQPNQIQHLQTMTTTPTVTFVPGITRSSTFYSYLRSWTQWLQLLQLPSFLEFLTSTPTVTFVPGITRSSTSKQWLQLLQLPSFLELPDPAPSNNDFDSYSYQIQHLQTMKWWDPAPPNNDFNSSTVPGITRSSTSKQWLQLLQLPSFLTRSSTSKQWLQLGTTRSSIFVPGITRSSTSKQWLQLLQLPSFLELPDPAVSTSKQWLQLLQLPSFLELPDPAPPNNDFNSYSYLRSWNYQIQHLQTMTSTPTVTFVPGITRSSTSKQWLQLLQLPSFLELPDPAPPNNDFNSYSYLRSWNYQIQHLQTMTSTPTVTFVPGITRSSTSKQWLQLLQLPSFLELPDPAPPNNDFNSYSYLRSWNYQIQHLQTMTSTPTVTFVPGITRSSTSKQWLQLLQLPSFL